MGFSAGVSFQPCSCPPPPGVGDVRNPQNVAGEVPLISATTNVFLVNPVRRNTSLMRLVGDPRNNMVTPMLAVSAGGGAEVAILKSDTQNMTSLEVSGNGYSMTPMFFWGGSSTMWIHHVHKCYVCKIFRFFLIFYS